MSSSSSIHRPAAGNRDGLDMTLSEAVPRVRAGEKTQNRAGEEPGSDDGCCHEREEVHPPSPLRRFGETTSRCTLKIWLRGHATAIICSFGDLLREESPHRSDDFRRWLVRGA